MIFLTVIQAVFLQLKLGIIVGNGGLGRIYIARQTKNGKTLVEKMGVPTNASNIL